MRISTSMKRATIIFTEPGIGRITAQERADKIDPHLRRAIAIARETFWREYAPKTANDNSSAHTATPEATSKELIERARALNQLADAPEEAERQAKEWVSFSRVVIQQAIKALWDDNPQEAYTASADGPGLVLDYFKHGRNQALAEVRRLTEENRKLAARASRLLMSPLNHGDFRYHATTLLGELALRAEPAGEEKEVAEHGALKEKAEAFDAASDLLEKGWAQMEGSASGVLIVELTACQRGERITKAKTLLQAIQAVETNRQARRKGSGTSG